MLPHLPMGRISLMILLLMKRRSCLAFTAHRSGVYSISSSLKRTANYRDQCLRTFFTTSRPGQEDESCVVDHRSPRVYVNVPRLSTGLLVPLSPEQQHYLSSVMRLREGGAVRAFNGRHGEYAAVLVSSLDSSNATPTAQRRMKGKGKTRRGQAGIRSGGGRAKGGLLALRLQQLLRPQPRQHKQERGDEVSPAVSSGESKGKQAVDRSQAGGGGGERGTRPAEEEEGGGSSALTYAEAEAEGQGPEIWLCVAPIKRQRLKLLVEKATEIGADRVLLVSTERTQESCLPSADALSKLRAVTVEAAEQCERLTLPQLEAEASSNSNSKGMGTLLSLADFLDGLGADQRVLLCRERCEQATPLLSELLRMTAPRQAEGDRSDTADNGSSSTTTRSSSSGDKSLKKILLLVGPEGGFSESEFAMMEAHANIRAVSLGPNVLRAETAALVALGCCRSALSM